MNKAADCSCTDCCFLPNRLLQTQVPQVFFAWSFHLCIDSTCVENWQTVAISGWSFYEFFMWHGRSCCSLSFCRRATVLYQFCLRHSPCGCCEATHSSCGAEAQGRRNAIARSVIQIKMVTLFRLLCSCGEIAIYFVSNKFSWFERCAVGIQWWLD